MVLADKTGLYHITVWSHLASHTGFAILLKIRVHFTASNVVNALHGVQLHVQMNASPLF